MDEKNLLGTVESLPPLAPGQEQLAHLKSGVTAKRHLGRVDEGFGLSEGMARLREPPEMVERVAAVGERQHRDLKPDVKAPHPSSSWERGLM